MEIIARYHDIPQRIRVISYMLAISVYSFMFILLFALWNNIEGSGLEPVELLLLSISALALAPILIAVALPYSAPGFLYSYRTPEERRIVTTSRMGLPFTIGLIAGTIFLLVYGVRITREVSNLGIYYLVVGIIGTVTSVYFAIKWSVPRSKFSTVVDISPSTVSITSMGTKVEMDTSSCQIMFNSSTLKPTITLSGKANVIHRDGRTSVETKSLVVNNFNSGKINMYTAYAIVASS